MESGASIRGGRYVIVGALGSGSQGETLDAVDKREGRPVAIKRFSVRGAKSWKDVELAEREARVLAALSHAGLPSYVEHFEEDGDLFLVMSRIEGESLFQLRARAPRRPAMGEREVLRMLIEVGVILDYLHRRTPAVIHRDVKPGNILRRADGSFALVDFGAVRDQLKPQGGSTIVGTFGYMAPEQFQGRALAGSDVYGLGATALAMLTGIDPEDLPHKGLGIDVDAALGGARERSDITRALTRALRAMLEPDPDKRPKSVKQALADASVPLPSATHPSPERGPAQRGHGVSNPSPRGDWRAHRRDEKEQRKAAWRAQRDALDAARAQRRESRRGSRGNRLYGPPLWLVSLLLFIAQRLVGLVMLLVLPLAMTILSIVFGAGLRRGARQLRDEGARAIAALDRAQLVIRGRSEHDDPRLRVEPRDETHDRADDALGHGDDADDADHTDDEDDDATAARRGGRGRS